MIGLGSDKKKEKAARKQKDLQRRKETTQIIFQEPIKEEVGSEHNEQGFQHGTHGCEEGGQRGD